MIQQYFYNYLLQKGYDESIQGWYDSLEIHLDTQAELLSIVLPHAYFADWFQKSWADVFQIHAQNAFTIKKIEYSIFNASVNEQIELKHKQDIENIIHKQDKETKTLENNAKDIPKIEKVSHITNESMTFDTFISNQKYSYLIKYTKRLCEETSFSSNITIIHGASGLGKTHILYSIAYQLQKNTKNFTHYEDPDQFFANFEMNVLKQGLIIIDNFHTVKKEQQQIMCQIFDSIKNSGKHCVIAGTDSPNTWPLQNPLRSRFSDAIWLSLPKPDLDIRLQYVHQWCIQKGLHIQKDQRIFIAQSSQTIRKLSGILQQLLVQEEFLKRPLNFADIENILENHEAQSLTPQDIIAQVATYYGMQATEILKGKRDKKRVQARYLAMFLCRELLGHSYPSIGRSFAGKDHSTVLYGIRKIKQLQKSDKDIDNDIQILTKLCLQKTLYRSHSY